MTVYVLRSESTGRYYTGCTEDLENRLHEHNAGENQSTVYGVPWAVIYCEEVATRSEANRLEKKIKARGAKRYLGDRGEAG